MRKSIIYLSIIALFTGGCKKEKTSVNTNAANTKNAGLISNPIVDISCADPSIVKHNGKFYIYATVDPWGSDELVVLETNDFIHFVRKHIGWPNLNECKSPTSRSAKIWAPGVVKGKDGKFHMYVSVHNEIWAGIADTPLGPWSNAKADATPLIPANMFEKYHMIDSEPFIDDDGQVYLYWGSGLDWKDGHCFAVKLNSDMVTYNKNDIEDITPPHYFEAPFMLKKNGIYYLMYSNGKCTDSSYEVRYSTSNSPLGPWKEGRTSPILVTSSDSVTLGPGHHTVFEEKGQHYILYHRIRDNHNTLLRELAIDSLNFGQDGTIRKVNTQGISSLHKY